MVVKRKDLETIYKFLARLPVKEEDWMEYDYNNVNRAYFLLRDLLAPKSPK